MNTHVLRQLIVVLVLLGIFLVPKKMMATSPDLYRYVLPNSHAKSLTTPSGWGAAYGTFYAGVSGTTDTPYAKDDAMDGGAAIGLGVWDPVEYVGVQVTLINLDITEWNNYGMNVHVHRFLGCANSVAVGVENIRLTENDGDAEESYYAVFSQGVVCDPFINEKTLRTRLHFSVGIGSGRYSEKSPLDIADGKGKYGTAVFGNVSYELFDSFNLVTEWNGVNLNVGAGKTFHLDEDVPLIILGGVGDLTDNSGDGARLFGGIGIAMPLL